MAMFYGSRSTKYCQHILTTKLNDAENACTKACFHLYDASMNLVASLAELGLTKNEALVYLALLEQGLVQAGPLVKSTKLHRMLVYTALERLEDMGLVTVAKKQRVQFFQAVDPTRFIDRIKRTQALAEAVVPRLQDLQQKQADSVTVKTLIGREGLITNLLETVESAAKHPSREICIMGGAGGEGNDPINYSGDWYEDYVELCRKQRIKKRLITTNEYVNLYAEQYAKHPNNQLRVLSSGFTSPVFTRVTHDLVSIEFYQPQITILQIRNAVIAKGYQESFEALWLHSKKA